MAAWGIWGVTMVLWTAWLVGLQISASRALLATGSGERLALDLGFWGIVLPVAVVAYAMVGLLITLRRPANAVGWLCLGLALVIVVHSAAFEWSLHTFETAPGSLPDGTAAALVSASSGELMMPLPVTLIVLTFPSGRPAGGKSWAVVALAGIATLVATAGQLASRSVYAGEHTAAANPLAQAWLAPGVPEAAVQVGDAVGVLALALAVIGLVIRTRRASGVERRQLSRFALTGGAGVAILAVGGILALLRVPWALVIAVLFGTGLLGIGLPITIWAAIAHHHLYDVDRVVNRALVYLALSVSLIAIYAAAVALASAAFQVRIGPGASLVAAGVVVVMFAPLRAGLQRAVNRLMYGERGDPYVILAALGKRLEESESPEAMLKTTVDALAAALRLSYVGVRFADGGLAAQYGEPIGAEIQVPLIHSTERVGSLVVSQDAPSRLVEDLARHVAAAVQAARVTVELREARERLITATEEERRTLRRELHDGLGPTLAGVTLRIQAAQQQVVRDPAGVHEALADVAEELRSAVSDVRRLARGLRPRSLDDLGLVEAVREQVARFAFNDSGLEVTVHAKGDLDTLPAAVEVAAFRIAVEAVTNAVRHARAKRCEVRFDLNGGLQVEVTDDGHGLSEDLRPGVGLVSMRARAEELGGRCDVIPAHGGGTRVLAHLPTDRPPR
jgi:signal transduction histidine kinase